MNVVYRNLLLGDMGSGCRSFACMRSHDSIGHDCSHFHQATNRHRGDKQHLFESRPKDVQRHPLAFRYLDHAKADANQSKTLHYCEFAEFDC